MRDSDKAQKVLDFLNDQATRQLTYLERQIRQKCRQESLLNPDGRQYDMADFMADRRDWVLVKARPPKLTKKKMRVQAKPKTGPPYAMAIQSGSLHLAFWTKTWMDASVDFNIATKEETLSLDCYWAFVVTPRPIWISKEQYCAHLATAGNVAAS